MAEPGATEITPRPTPGRVFTRGRRVRLADVDPQGRCRLDAIVRHLQDVARDDSADSNLPNPMNWVVRRTMAEVRKAPVYQEWIELSTWCSGYGGRWAERRTQVVGQNGAEVEAATIWVHIDPETMRPTRLSKEFFDIWGETAGERRISARSNLPLSWPADANSQPWPLRFTDLDLLGHVNNSAHWAAVEQAMLQAGCARGPMRVELEHNQAIDFGEEVWLRWQSAEGGVDTWLSVGNATRSVAKVRPL